MKPLPETLVLSLGAGVQSSTLALMAQEAFGTVSKPDFAVFADTQWEPQEVYDHLDWLEERLDFPVIRTTRSNLRLDTMTQMEWHGKRSFISIPTFTLVEGEDPGSKGIRTRQCTVKYKVEPIHQVIRERVLDGTERKRLTSATPVVQMLGISTDEIYRMREAREKWCTNKYPLIDMGFSRGDCVRWFAERFPGYTLPRSACIGCPYHSDAEWADMLKNRPEQFQDAIEVDDSLRVLRDDTPRDSYVHFDKAGNRTLQYLHAKAQPLRELVPYFEEYKAPEARDQLSLFNQNWNNECEGMCGV